MKFVFKFACGVHVLKIVFHLLQFYVSFVHEYTGLFKIVTTNLLLVLFAMFERNKLLSIKLLTTRIINTLILIDSQKFFSLSVYVIKCLII